MKIIHHSQRQQSTCWLCTRGSAGALGWSPTRRDSASTAVTHGMCVQPRSSGQGCLLVGTEVLVPLTCPSSPFEALSPGAGGHSKAVSMRMGCFSPLLWRRHWAPAGRRREGEDRGSYLGGDHQGHWVHLIRHCSILGLPGAPRSYQMTSAAAASRHSQGCCTPRLKTP